MKRKAKTRPVTEQQLVDPIEHAIPGFLAHLPNPPWQVTGFSWPRPQGADRDAFLVPMAIALEQAAQWVQSNAHGPRWLSMLRDLAVHLDLGCSLPEHGVVVQQIRDHVEYKWNSAEERATAAQRLRKLAEGMRFYVQSREPRPVRSWEAPSSWPSDVRHTAHAIQDEVERAAGYCRAWSQQPVNHPCHEGDSAGELWARPWAHADDLYLAGNCRVQIRDGDVLERELRNFIDFHRADAKSRSDAFFAAVSAYNGRVNGLKPRALKDNDLQAIPSFLTWSQELRKLASDWRILVCTESLPSAHPSIASSPAATMKPVLTEWRHKAIRNLTVRIGPVLDTWYRDRVAHPSRSRLAWQEFPGWWSSLKDELKFDRSIWEWASVHIIQHLDVIDPLSDEAPEQVRILVERMVRLASVLEEGKQADALVWDVARPVAVKDFEVTGQVPIKYFRQKPELEPWTEPLEMPTLLKLAGLNGPDAVRKPLGRMLANLRAGGERGKTVYELTDGGRGGAHTRGKTNLLRLAELGLAEFLADGKRWRVAPGGRVAK